MPLHTIDPLSSNYLNNASGEIHIRKKLSQHLSTDAFNVENYTEN